MIKGKDFLRALMLHIHVIFSAIGRPTAQVPVPVVPVKVLLPPPHISLFFSLKH
jgi:hypothetical protein